jgi:hypothetical protein
MSSALLADRGHKIGNRTKTEFGVISNSKEITVICEETISNSRDAQISADLVHFN